MNIIGRLTKDAQISTLPSDKQVINFSVAVNDSYRNKQGVGRILKAYAFHQLMDVYGDVPYFNEGKCFIDKKFQPEYDETMNVIHEG